jgi:hypothetical protein
MAQNAPSVASNQANAQQRAMMAKYGGATQNGWTIRKATIPQLRLNLGFDRWRSGPNPEYASFNNDFDTSFAIGEEP